MRKYRYAALACFALLLPVAAGAGDSSPGVKRIEFRMEIPCSGDDVSVFTLPDAEERICLSRKAVAGGQDIVSATMVQHDTSMSAVSIVFTESSSARLRAETAAHVGARIGVVVGGRLVLAPRIMEAVSSPVEISGMRADLEAIVAAIGDTAQ